jgi:hypothetical protein
MRWFSDAKVFLATEIIGVSDDLTWRFDLVADISQTNVPTPPGATSSSL